MTADWLKTQTIAGYPGSYWLDQIRGEKITRSIEDLWAESSFIYDDLKNRVFEKSSEPESVAPQVDVPSDVYHDPTIHRANRENRKSRHTTSVVSKVHSTPDIDRAQDVIALNRARLYRLNNPN